MTLSSNVIIIIMKRGIPALFLKDPEDGIAIIIIVIIHREGPALFLEDAEEYSV